MGFGTWAGALGPGPVVRENWNCPRFGLPLLPIHGVDAAQLVAGALSNQHIRGYFHPAHERGAWSNQRRAAVDADHRDKAANSAEAAQACLSPKLDKPLRIEAEKSIGDSALHVCVKQFSQSL